MKLLTGMKKRAQGENQGGGDTKNRSFCDKRTLLEWERDQKLRWQVPESTVHVLRATLCGLGEGLA